jgi:hypothetical protein
MPDGIQIGSDPRSVEYLRRRRVVRSPANSAQWDRFPTAIKEASLFSATVTSAQLLGQVGGDLGDLMAEVREKTAKGEAVLDRRTLVSRWKKTAEGEGLGFAEGDKRRGTIEDITSIPRLNLIYTVQTQRAEGYASYLGDQEPGALDAFPAQELVRLESRRDRRHWHERWRAAGGRVFPGSGLDGREGRLIALKTDAVWERINRFGTPWPPFDFGSGVGVADVPHAEAVSLGVLKAGETVKPGVKDFTSRMEASAAGLPAELREELKTALGDQVRFEGDRVVMRDAPPVAPPAEPPPAAPDTPPPPAPTPAPAPPATPEIQLAQARADGAGLGPDVVRRIGALPGSVARHLKGVQFKSATGGAHYSRGERTITLGRDPSSWHGLPTVLDHELGHHLHYELGVVTNAGPSEAMAAAMTRSRATWTKATKARLGAGWTKTWSSVDACRIDIAKAIFDRTLSELSLAENARVARVTDTVLGLTKGTYGAGHSRAYMKAKGPHEAFANTFQAIMDGDKWFEEAFPELVDFVKKALDL